MYIYAKRDKVHRVEQGERPDSHCGIPLTAFTLPVPPPGDRCHYCWEDEDQAVAREQRHKRRLRRLVAASAATAAFIGLASGVTVGGFVGVILSPDIGPVGSGLSPTPDTAGPSPSPSCDPGTLVGCGDLILIIERYIDEALLRHLTIDHPAPSPTPTTAPSNPTATPSSDGNSSGSTEQRSTPTTRPTARPKPTTAPAAPTSAPVVSPAPTPCFHPGNPQGSRDPCSWPPDDK